MQYPAAPAELLHFGTPFRTPVCSVGSYIKDDIKDGGEEGGRDFFQLNSDKGGEIKQNRTLPETHPLFLHVV